jgi:hypothetical protein
MRRTIQFMTVALTLALVTPAATASAQSYGRGDSRLQVDIGFFYDELDPYGDWVELQDHGWCFAPRVDRGWRPYTRGHWVLTDDGWFWASDERFGWAAYHYGRWVDDPYYGWIWVPGYEWAPAWVSWRYGNGYIGWAPLPPRVSWQARLGLNIGGLEIDAFIGAWDYVFVRDQMFIDRSLTRYVLPPAQNLTIINVTNNVTNYSAAGDRAINTGVPVASVERAVGRAVPRARAVDVDRAAAATQVRSGEVTVFRPAVKAERARRPAQGRSLVRGEAPPPLLAERRRAREAERRQRGAEVETTAKEAQQRPARPSRRDRGEIEDRPAAPPAVDAGRLGAAEQQRVERERQLNEQRQRDQGAQAERQRAAEQQRAERERQLNEQRQRDRSAQAERQRAAEQQRAERERQLNEQRQRDQAAQAERQRAAEEQRAERERQRTQPPPPPQRNNPPKEEKKEDDRKGPKPKPTRQPA